MKKLIFCFITLILSVGAFAQDTTTKITAKDQNLQAIESYKRLAEELKGKYQIQVVNSRQQQIISYDLLKEIKNKMKDNEDVIFKASPNLQILVLSKTKQQTARFSEEETTIFIEE